MMLRLICDVKKPTTHLDSDFSVSRDRFISLLLSVFDT